MEGAPPTHYCSPFLGAVTSRHTGKGLWFEVRQHAGASLEVRQEPLGTGRRRLRNRACVGVQHRCTWHKGVKERCSQVTMTVLSGQSDRDSDQ